MAKLLASSQITIVDLNDAVSLRSYIGSTHPRVQFLSNGGTYTPSFSEGNVLTLSVEMTKIGDNTDLVQHPGNVVSRVDWYIKIAPSQEYVKITPDMDGYELDGTAPLFKRLKIKKNIMDATHPGFTVKSEIDFKESWMPEIHTQISEIDFSLTVQGEDGKDSYTGILTNSSHTIICNADGTADTGEVGINGRAFSDVIAYKGTKILTPVNSNPTAGQFSISLTPTNCTAVKKDSDTFYIDTLVSNTGRIDPSGTLSSDNIDMDTVSRGGKVLVTFNMEGVTTMKQEMTFSKVFNGTDGQDGLDGRDGESAKYITLAVKEGTTTFKYDKGATSPNISKTVLEAIKFNIGTANYKWFIFQNSSWNLINGQTDSTLTINATDSYFNTQSSVTFKCTVNDLYSDQITISKIVDGSDSYLASLSNESHVIACYSNGVFKSGESDRAVTDVVAYKGSTPLALTSGTPGNGQYKIDIVANSAITYTLSNNTIKITEMTADSAVLVINVNCEGTIIKKTMSLSKAKDGREGVDGYVAALTNEFHSLPARPDGTITSYNGCSTSIELRKGADLVTQGVTYSAIPNAGVTGSMNGNTYTVTELSVDTSSVNLTATYNGKNYSKLFTVTKNKQGNHGVDSTSYWLLPSVTAINKDKNGNLSTNSIVYTSKSQTGSQSMINYNGRFKIYASHDKGGSFGDPVYTSSVNESTTTFNITDDITAIKCELYMTDGITMVDTQTVIITTDGQDGIDGVDAAYVLVSGESVFKYGPNFLGTPSPATITLSRALYNINGGRWQYHNGTTWTDFNPSQNGSTLEVTPTMAHFATSTNKAMRVRYYISDSIYDETSIVKIADGVDGTNAYTVVLSNPSHTVPANSSGEVTSGNLATCTTDVIVYKGTNKIKPVISNLTSVPNNLFTVTNATDSTNAKITMSSFPANIDSAICTFDVSAEGQVLKQIFTVTKAKQGIQGNSVKSVDVSGPQMFKYVQGNDTPTPNSITISAVEHNFTASSRKWYADGTVVSGQNGTNLTINPSDSYWGSKTSITFKYEATIGSETRTDSITVSKVYDGTDTYSVILTNEAHGVACDKDGHPLNGELEKAFTNVKVFRGSTELTASNTADFNKFKLTIGTCTGATADFVKTNNISTGVKLTNLTTDAGTVNININIDNGKASIDKVFSFSKLKTGATGASAKVIQITGSSTIIQKKDGSYEPSNGVTLTAVKKNASGTVVWKVNGTQLGTGDTYTVAASNFASIKTYTIRAELQNDSSVYDEHNIVKVTDGTDSITTYVWCPNGSTIKNENMQSLTVEGVVFSGATNVSTNANAKYHWQKKVGNNWVDIKGTSTAPVAGNAGGNNITINRDDIPYMLVVKCEISYGDVKQSNTQVLEDISDPIQANIFSTAGTTFKNGKIETFLVTRVIRNGQDLDPVTLYKDKPTSNGSQGEIIYVKSENKYYKFNNNAWTAITTPSAGDNSAYTYTWSKVDNDGNIENNWTRTGKIIHISEEDVSQINTFIVDVEGQ